MSGIFGVVSEGNCADVLFYGTDYHSHLGTEKAGLAVWDSKLHRVIHDISQTQFKSKFAEDYKKMVGDRGIGVISDRDAQPIIIKSKFGTFAIAVAGLVKNSRELASQLLKDGYSLVELSAGEINPVEIVGKLITQGKDLVGGIEGMFERVKGSVSLLLLTKEGIYAARDKLGHTSLVVGESPQGFAVASESSAFPNLGFKIKKELAPGEIALITREGIKRRSAGGHESKVCAFLWIYVGDPASSYEGIGVEQVRENCGKLLAKKDKVESDLAAGVPDSGIGHAIGYAIEAKLPFRRPLVKYTAGYGRSYTPPSQEIRDKIATMKLIPVKDIIKGKRIILCEDSIVRGTQLKNFTLQKLWESGAKEVHVRVACPPLMYPCIYTLSTRFARELIARRAVRAIEGKELENLSEYLEPNSKKYKKLVEWIRKYIGATTLKYQTLDDMVRAIGLPKEKLCLYCWCGK